jgi:hypothetical protein
MNFIVKKIGKILPTSWKLLESDEFLQIHLKFYFHFVSWRNGRHSSADNPFRTNVWSHSTVLGRERLENLRILNPIWIFEPAKSETEHERSSVVLFDGHLHSHWLMLGNWITFYTYILENSNTYNQTQYQHLIHPFISTFHN